MASAKTITSLSEENTFESGFIRDEDERPKVAYNQFSNEIPVISIAGIDEVNGRREEICKKIVEACEEWGIFQIVDHGVDTKLISEMTHLSRKFFALPPEEKLRFDMSGGKKGGFVVSSHLQVIILTIFIFYPLLSYIYLSGKYILLKQGSNYSCITNLNIVENFYLMLLKQFSLHDLINFLM